MSAIPQLAIVVPCYNEQEVLPETTRRLTALLDRLMANQKCAPTSNVIYVDDGSKDATWALIRDANKQDTRMRGIKLSANRGHQTAVLAGVFYAEGDVVISIDA